ncbi:hypothetical protein [Chlamydiifrater volucris]|uniref:hypothetical protein n=1 Tax=Chlamydiifrater volucris TaxID=2681470 RepID=UPI001BCBD1E2|nr:hypothetical protein [Chlamydiifrater volucris]
MSVGVFGVNYRLASSRDRETVIGFFCRLKERQQFLGPSVLLITCNRAEIYFSSDTERSSLLLEFQKRFHHLGVYVNWGGESQGEEDLPCGYLHLGLDCFTHLFRVVAGCDSVVLGETEIQGQVKRAYTQTIKKEKIPSVLHYLFQKALKEGKRFRSTNLLKEKQVTTEAVVHSLLEGIPLDAKTIFVGYSTINCRIASFFRRRGRSNFIFCSESINSAKKEKIIPRKLLSFFDDYEVVIFGTTADFSQTPMLLGGLFSLPGRIVIDLSVPSVVSNNRHLDKRNFFDMKAINDKIRTFSLSENADDQKNLAMEFLDFSAEKYWNFFLKRVSGQSTRSYGLSYEGEVVTC